MRGKHLVLAPIVFLMGIIGFFSPSSAIAATSPTHSVISGDVTVNRPTPPLSKRTSA